MSFFSNAPVKTPTTQEIYTFIIDDYKSRNGAPNLLTRGIVKLLSWGIAGVWILLFRYGTWSIKQIFPQTAEIEATTLIGERYGVYQGSGETAIMEASVTGATASEIPNTALYTINGVVYTVNANYTVTDGDATIQLVAPEEGEDYTLDEITPDVLNLVNPIIGVPETCTVTAVLTEGEDAETHEDYTQRVIDRTSIVPQGGSANDYYLWTVEVTGIVDVYVYMLTSGIIEVYGIATGTGSERVPTSAELTAIEEAIEEESDSVFQNRRPIEAQVQVKAVIEEDYTVSITGFLPNDSSVKTQVKTALTSYFDERRAENPSLNKTGLIIYVDYNDVSAIITSVLNLNDGQFDTLEITESAISVDPRKALGMGVIANLDTLNINGASV